MNIQEQEERDFHPMTDAQNAYAWSQANRRPDHPKIADHVAAGRFVVVHEVNQYCPSTDAYIGTRRLFGSSHVTRAEAVAALASCIQSYGYDEDVRSYILPELEQERPDDCPLDLTDGLGELYAQNRDTRNRND